MKDITVQELKERMEKGENLNVIDVREPFEYEEYNIDGKNIPLGNLPHSIEELEYLKGQEIIVHCKSGARSANAKKFLESKGFKNIRNLIGGVEAWKEV